MGMKPYKNLIAVSILPALSQLNQIKMDFHNDQKYNH